MWIFYVHASSKPKNILSTLVAKVFWVEILLFSTNRNPLPQLLKKFRLLREFSNLKEVSPFMEKVALAIMNEQQCSEEQYGF